MLRRRPSLPKPATLPGVRTLATPFATRGEPAALLAGSRWPHKRRRYSYSGHGGRTDQPSDTWRLRPKLVPPSSPWRRLALLALLVATAGAVFGSLLVWFHSSPPNPVDKGTSSRQSPENSLHSLSNGREDATLDQNRGESGSDGRIFSEPPAQASRFRTRADVINGSYGIVTEELRAGLDGAAPWSLSIPDDHLPVRSDGLPVAQTTAFVIPRGGPYTYVRHSHSIREDVGRDGLQVQSRPPFQTLPSDAYQPHVANVDRAPYAPVIPLKDTFHYLRTRPVPRHVGGAPGASPVTGPQAGIEGHGGIAVAYVLLCHDMDSVAGAGEFMDAVYTHPNLTRFFVHLDAKAGTDVLIALHSIVVKYPRDAAIIVYPRMRVEWGAVSMVKAELLALKAAETMWAEWDFAIVVSGTSFPVQSVCERERWLASLDPRTNLVFYEGPWKVCHWGATSWDEHCKKQRGRCLDKECTRMSHTPDNGVVYKGPQWVLLSREFAFYAANSHHSRRWVEYFEDGSHASDEMFFPTLLMNSPFREMAQLPAKGQNGVSKPLSGMIYVFWNSWRRNGCRSYRSSAPWGWSPCLLGNNDLHDLARSDKQFARKFRAGDPVKERLRRLWRRTCPLETPLGDMARREDTDPLANVVEVDDNFSLPWSWKDRAYQMRNLVIWAFDGTRDWILGNLDRLLMDGDSVAVELKPVGIPMMLAANSVLEGRK